MSKPDHLDPPPPVPRPFPLAGAMSVLAIAVLAGALVLVLQNVIAIPFVFEANYNEGWNVYNTQRFFAHETVYDDNLWRVNNYPPLSFLVVGGLDRIIGDPLLSGRLVALLSFAALGLLCAMAVARLGGDRTAALFAGGCALGFCSVAAPAWVAADDPQTLAETIMLGGLVVYLAGPPTRARLHATAGLVMLAGFTKHNLVAIPIAITLDLALRRTRQLPFWLLACSGLAVAFWGLSVLGAGGSFLAHILQPRTFAWWSVKFHALRFLTIFAAPLLLIVWFSMQIFSRDRLVLAAYGALAIASGALFSGWEGASYNMLQDAAVFLAIAAGLLLQELRKPESGGTGYAAAAAIALALVMTLPMIARVPQALAELSHPARLLAADREAERSFLADAAYVADRHGPAICESLLLCYRAGQPFWLDPFNSRQYILAGRLDQAPLLARIAAREIAVVQLRAEICDGPAAQGCSISHDPPKFLRFTDELLYAIDRHYRIDRRSPLGVFYVPK
jgi:hypothetical protein